LLLGLLLWWVGFRQHGGATSWLPAGAAIAVSIAAIALLPISDPAAASGGETSGATTLAALPYSPEKLAELRAAGTPTFVYMTADWCLTCKVNEKGAMSSAAVSEAFKAKGITVLEGDWTRGDPKISAWLAEQGRAGVPVYMFYAADGTATELPQILTVDTLTALAG
jgi:thiol:disulfide interchange protein